MKKNPTDHGTIIYRQPHTSARTEVWIGEDRASARLVSRARAQAALPRSSIEADAGASPGGFLLQRLGVS